MDRQIRTERAWFVPYALAEKLGGFEFHRLAGLNLGTCRRLMTKPEHLHRFPEEMAKNLHSAIMTIRDRYRSRASQIWANRPSSAALILRFLEFRGVGPKIATMAANILARQFKIPLRNYFAIDISPDTHVRRVFYRLGLVPEDAGAEQVVYAARDLNPSFPGLVDSPVWRIGRDWCHVRQPQCSACSMRGVCPSSTYPPK